MKTVTATEMKQRLGQYLTAALVEPVVVEKSGQPVIVMLSMAEYERFQALEDAYWGERARQAEQDGFTGYEETIRRIQERLNAEA
ncbi:MAG TPA: type II toxin-antitoxin system Phd/YefM family antitoxin [Candidatus Contendobacter sp.]|mgnify:FL=1|nr:type II toxin-antitoxin system Phd/YefM family antitoxin [Candidatus Contendobacter sp.]